MMTKMKILGGPRHSRDILFLSARNGTPKRNSKKKKHRDMHI
jgi:hypothetical protein